MEFGSTQTQKRNTSWTAEKEKAAFELPFTEENLRPDFVCLDFLEYFTDPKSASETACFYLVYSRAAVFHISVYFSESASHSLLKGSTKTRNALTAMPVQVSRAKLELDF